VAHKVFKAGFDLEEVCKILQELDGIAEFHAWQLACDLDEAKCWGDVKDNYTLLGPVTKKGLTDIFGKKCTQTVQCQGSGRPPLREHEVLPKTG
jgi:hypothetical protein